MIRIESREIDRLIATVRRVPEQIDAALRRGLVAGLRSMVRRAQNYPPPLPNQQYVRTYALRRGWQQAPEVVMTAGPAITASATNPVAYVPFVQTRETQAAIHQGRWQTTEAIEQAQRATATQAVEDELRAVARQFEGAA